MNSHDLAALVPWLIAHGYLIFLVAAIIEGPLTTIASGVVAALGFFNIYLILFLALLADIAGDVMYFGIGYYSQNLIRLPIFKRLGLSEERIEKMKILVHSSLVRALLLVKLSPIIGPIGLITIGATRPKMKKFFWPALAISVPKSFFFVLLGYFSGHAYLQLNRIISQGQYIAIGLFVFLGLAYLAYIKIMSLITKKISKSEL
ncbi:MAG: VTT domain-containing protein [Candidatus Falkowbacteria bacterium]